MPALLTRRRLLAAGFLMASLKLSAQTSKLTLAECSRLAESVPSAVSAARHEARIAALGVNAVRTSFLPQSVFNGGYIYNSPAGGGIRFVALNGQHEYLATANIGLLLDTSGRAAHARSKVDRDIAEATTRITGRDLRRSVTLAYCGVLAARKMAESAEASLTEERSFEFNTRARFTGGEAAQADVEKTSAQTSSFAIGAYGDWLDFEHFVIHGHHHGGGHCAQERHPDA